MTRPRSAAATARWPALRWPVLRRAGVAVLVLAVLAGCGDTAAGQTDPPTGGTTGFAGPVVPQATESTTASAVAPGPAQSALAALPVKGRAPTTGYSREQFGQRWSDDVDVPGGHDGCDTRSDILRRDLQDVVLKPGTNGCVPVSGVLHDPYTGEVLAFTRGEQTSPAVQIDHVVSLSDAWQTGAQQLTATRRQDLANDPVNLLAVDGPTNQAKGNGDAATWLPPVKGFRCTYVATQIEVKTRYGLWVTPAERDAMQTVLGTCPGQALPSDPGR